VQVLTGKADFLLRQQVEMPPRAVAVFDNYQNHNNQ